MPGKGLLATPDVSAELRCRPTPDLEVLANNLPRWSQPEERRQGWRRLHLTARYSTMFRAANLVELLPAALPAAARSFAERLIAAPPFSALAVVHGQDILLEYYAPDATPAMPHSIQSISKTLLNLIIGGLVETGQVELDAQVRTYIPEIGSGYAAASVQQVLDMDVANSYTEDFADPAATYYTHEEAMGWRLPANPARELTQHEFLPSIERGAAAEANAARYQYKDANTEVLGWIAERASGRPLRAFIADIVDAAGLEHGLHVSTDRVGTPALSGGVSLSARDLARYFSLFPRRGAGVGGRRVGSAAFLEATLAGGIALPPPNDHIRYSNHLRVNGRHVMHSGWGGQYAVADMDSGVVAVCFTILEDVAGSDADHFRLLRESLTGLVNACK